MTAENLARKVKQLDEDVLAIYELLTKISDTQDQHTDQLEQLRTLYLGHDRRLDDHSERFDAHSQRFDNIDTRLDTHSQRFDNIDDRLEEIIGLLRAG